MVQTPDNDPSVVVLRGFLFPKGLSVRFDKVSMGCFEETVMVNNKRDIQFIKGRIILVSAYWIGMIWTISGIATIIYSNIILRSGFNSFLGIPPFNVKNPVATALLIFPGTIILGVAACIIQNKHKKPLSELVYYFLLAVILGTIFIIVTLVGIKLVA